MKGGEEWRGRHGKWRKKGPLSLQEENNDILDEDWYCILHISSMVIL